jgi:hypothetical protein
METIEAKPVGADGDWDAAEETSFFSSNPIKGKVSGTQAPLHDDDGNQQVEERRTEREDEHTGAVMEVAQLPTKTIVLRLAVLGVCVLLLLLSVVFRKQIE